MRLSLTQGVPHMPVVAVYARARRLHRGVPEARHRRLQEARPQLSDARASGSGRSRARLRRRRARRGAGRSTRLRGRARGARTTRARRNGERATPAPTSVSSVWRSRMRSRVITGTASAVNVCSSSPQRAPHATLRPVRLSASSAMRMRCSRVSSRKRWMRARRAAAVAASSASSGYSGSARRADHEDLLAVGGDLGGPGEPVVGQPAGEPAFERAVEVCVLFRHCFITSLLPLQATQTAQDPDATMPPAGGTEGASSRSGLRGAGRAILVPRRQ